MKRSLLLGAFVALVWAPLSAEDSSSDFDSLAAAPADEASTPAADLGSLKWAGDQTFDYRYGAYDPATRTGGQVDSQLSAEYKYGPFKLTGAASVRNNEFVPGETLLTFASGPLKVSAGLAEFSWGVADANNPTDTLNNRDYRYGANAKRLVNPAVTAALYPTDWMSVEAVYEPWKDPAKFPKDFQANTQSGLATSKSQLVAYLNSHSQAALASLLTSSYSPKATQDDVAHDASQPVVGGRLNFFLPGVDLAASYVYDRDTYLTPVVTLKQYAGSVWLPETVELAYKRVQRVGLNAKTTIDKYGLWLETAYNITEDPAGTDDGIRNNKLTWTTGFDFSWGPSSAWYVNLQYAGSWIPNYDATTYSDYANATPSLTDKTAVLRQTYRSLTNAIGAETEEWLHGATWSLKFPFTDLNLTPTFSGAVMVPVNYDRTASDGTVRDRVLSAYFKPECEWAPVDGVKVRLGGDLAYGWIKKDGSSDLSLDTTTDKLGTYTPQNSVYVEVNYQWNGSWGSK